MLSNFYRLNDNAALEICLILFSYCNLNCAFCFENHSGRIDTDYIRDIPNRVDSQLCQILKTRGYDSVVFRIWGGELFADEIGDGVFDIYEQVVNELKSVCGKYGVRSSFSFGSNLVFRNTGRVFRLLEKTGSAITTSYDPIYRFKDKEQADTWQSNSALFKPECVSITLTKQNIDAYVGDRSHFDILSGFNVYIEYYIATELRSFFQPSSDDLFRFYKYYYDGKYGNISEIDKIVESYRNPNGRYCTCNNSCLLIDGKLTFNCLKRSSNLGMDEFFDVIPSDGEYTEKQLELALKRNGCLTCRHFGYCRNFCLASVLHKEYDSSSCALARFYDYIGKSANG